MLTVLYAEDNIDVQTELKDVLADYFKTVLVASNGEEALELFKRNKVDLVLTDILMPKMSGLELAKEIKNINPYTPILFVTAHSEYKYLLEGIKLRVDGYILKPVDIKALGDELNLRIEDIKLKYNLKLKEKLLQEYKDTVDESMIVSKANTNGIITYANEAFSKLSGYKVDELIGSNHNIIRHPDTPKYLFDDLWKTILSKHTWKGKIQNKRKDGTGYWVEVNIKPILDEDNNIVEFISARRDITLELEYKKSLQKTVKEQVEKLRSQDKILQFQSKQAAMGEMIDAIAHQWKQPLNIINMKSNFLVAMNKGKDFVSMKDIKRCDNDISQQVKHLVSTLEEFRNFLRPNKQKNLFHVKNTVKSIQILIKDELISNKISLELKVIDDIQLDSIENELKHVFINFINNSKDAFVENKIENRKVTIELQKQNDKSMITIEDNAGGIPDEIIDHIFEPNITSKSKDKGTGIGLYMSKQIIEKFGGSVDVSNRNNGACFKIVY